MLDHPRKAGERQRSMSVKRVTRWSVATSKSQQRTRQDGADDKERSMHSTQLCHTLHMAMWGIAQGGIALKGVIRNSSLCKSRATSEISSNAT